MRDTATSPVNPFHFGSLALDDAFADRRDELADLKADALAGQDVVLLAPRRVGKSSLLWRASQELVRQRTLVAQVDLMTTPTVTRLAEKLAQSIHEDIASPLFRARERLRVFQGLRITPTITVDPEDGSLNFSFTGGAAAEDVSATLERLLDLPGQLAGERNRRVVLVLDEFQEITEIDPGLPRLMRAAFQRQPEVSHIYLGSKRHTMERIFNDANEPFWRSAKRVELGLIDPEEFGTFVVERFAGSGKKIDDHALEAIFAVTRGHPYATQELCYFLWQRTGSRASAGAGAVTTALAEVLRSEDSHFTALWERATSHQRLLLQSLAREEGHPLAGEYRRRHGLPSGSSVQRALLSLERAELVSRSGGLAWISEPFLAQWLVWRTR